MKASYNWLKEYLNLENTTPEQLADQITLTGIEVDSLIVPGEGLKKLVVGEVRSVERMEGSDHLNITQVDVGEAELYQIVCGAPNVAKNQKVVVALPGARLPGNFKIKKSKLRGHVSNGMICSLDELGFSDSVIPKRTEDGIYTLPEEAIVGEEALSYLGLDDIIIDLDITPNRADAMSMRGVAYEVGTILSQKPDFKEMSLSENADESIENYVDVSVESKQDTPYYKLRIVKDVTVKESPLWLQRKLMNAGIRPIDSVVDVTNYIMLEYGQPLHAFDYDALDSKEIYVRRANQDEKIITLDGQERILNQENLVVTNGQQPVALAGVMGGQNSHVTQTTKTVAIESAVFASSLIRKTAQSLNLRSESSSRFERGLNLGTVEAALDHAAALIAEISEGQIVSGIAEIESTDPLEKRVSITLERINHVLGTRLSLEEVASVFARLQFEYTLTEDKFTVSVPLRRWDISIEADLLEEVARVYGYNNIPSTLPVMESTPGELDDKQRLTRFIHRFLEGSGLAQTISYALTTPEKAKRFSLKRSATTNLDWPMSEEHQTLRLSLISGLVDNAAYNAARQAKNIALYEVGHVFYDNQTGTLPLEEEHVAGLLSGDLAEKTWSDSAKPVDFYSLKGIVEELLETIGIKETIQYVATSSFDDLHPGRTAAIYLGEKKIGLIGQIHPQVTHLFDLEDTYVFELNIDALVKAEKNSVLYEAIPKYPGTSRDIALLVQESVSHKEVMNVIKSNGGKWLQQVRLFDLYQGEHIQPGKKSIAYSLAYLNPEATLKEEEVNKDFEKVKEALQKDLDAEIR
ncbi:phenylalanine--tRNA ligase subunit beta [Marinilactibacillus sp. 15R]|uniref:Phenylalanine--tRNA ligase beta subunit n=1 Tax=Marinilactibacillus piezotolerans TaxID=258723 RepID=A0A1I3Y1H7_9LACT|nr:MULTISPECIES: phenylalanine--tRNA ligase subunit beta [Marinilactibacillus]API89989.1 phenylalanine--tRNA ligase subunit beta [Marinilactibacillus sp. 15R]SFK25269.1 phenylalanyl-tRNA synthetase beta subunit [Marinilactibacillus piezotolerans]